MSSRPGFLNYIHIFRGLAILLIVTLHVLLATWNSDHPISRSLQLITTNSTVLFVFIAGYLFQYLNSVKFEWGGYLKKKFLYVVVPYIITSIPIMVKKLYFDTELDWWMDESYQKLPELVKPLYMLVTGHQFGPFWFIPMIILYYMAAPILIRIGNSRTSSYLIPIIGIAGLWTITFGDYTNSLVSFIHFLPVYLLGQWASVYYNPSKIKIIFPVAMILCYITITIFEYKGVIPFDHYIEIKESGELVFMLNWSKLKAILLCFILLSLLYLVPSNKSGFIRLSADYSFAIYFLHLYFLNLWLEINEYFGLLAINTGIIFISSLSLVVASCLLTIFLVKKMTKNSRILIGS